MNTTIAGLLLIGGKSSRMGRDKGKLAYRGISQRLYGYALLEAVCGKAYFSCTEAQADELHDFPCIVDQYPGQGPLGGILTAFESYPHTSFLVLACDMPRVALENLQHLLGQRNPTTLATVMQHPRSGRVEPLFAIWEDRIYPSLQNYWEEGERSPTGLLDQIPVQRVWAGSPEILENINTYQEYRAHIAE
ncbi:MAG: molybdenum cofactor guanylyltransferase [Bacteroidota bacterium]